MNLTEEEFLAIAKTQYAELSQKLDKAQNFYEYEKALDEELVSFGRAVLEQSVTEKDTKDYKKKT